MAKFSSSTLIAFLIFHVVQMAIRQTAVKHTLENTKKNFGLAKFVGQMMNLMQFN